MATFIVEVTCILHPCSRSPPVSFRVWSHIQLSGSGLNVDACRSETRLNSLGLTYRPLLRMVSRCTRQMVGVLVLAVCLAAIAVDGKLQQAMMYVQVLQIVLGGTLLLQMRTSLTGPGLMFRCLHWLISAAAACGNGRYC